jgi:uncharacterized protein (TIGR02246 family)
MEKPVFKSIRAILFLGPLLLLSSFEQTSSSKHQENIQNLVVDFVSAWNRHDAKALAAFWAQDGDLIPLAEVNVIRGREAIEQYFEEAERDRLKDAYLKLSVQNIHMIDPETAFVDADFTISGLKVAGVESVPIHDHAIYLLVKQDGKWQILIARPY